MESLSVFDIFKIGVGPSSSHTMGPWLAALEFIEKLDSNVDKIEVHLFGSLSKTGKGHGTDLAVMLGLEGFHPKTIDTALINSRVDEITIAKQIRIKTKEIGFDKENDIIFHNTRLDFHPNGMQFIAFYQGKESANETYFSIGGGFICQEGEITEKLKKESCAFQINSEKDLLHHLEGTGYSIAELVYENELTWKTKDEINNEISTLWSTMLECMFIGCHTPGHLPGGLRVRRRAADLNKELISELKYDNAQEWLKVVRYGKHSFQRVTKWVSCFALAINEQNASFGRVVTAPTNGAAGVIPAVLAYMLCFTEHQSEENIKDFILVAGEIGSLFKKGSTISAALGGCQAEIGVSSSMAAAALTHCQGGTYQQVLQAAEIAMEHHLGLTCDPINGLVQVPCIERNTMGAMKAITASEMALSSNPEEAKVTLDGVIKTMKETAADMNEKYKETSEGGLAISVVVPEC
jgi:L-serine dehydratase